MLATHLVGLAGALDINDNGRLGWADLLAWVFFGTVGVFGAAVVAGVAFGGLAVAVGGIRRMAGSAWSGVRHRDDPGAGRRRFAFLPGRSGPEEEQFSSRDRSAPRHRVGSAGQR